MKQKPQKEKNKIQSSKDQANGCVMSQIHRLTHVYTMSHRSTHGDPETFSYTEAEVRMDKM